MVEKFREFVTKGSISHRIPELKGKTLVCHCSPSEMCHVDVLVELASREKREVQAMGVAGFDAVGQKEGETEASWDTEALKLPGGEVVSEVAGALFEKIVLAGSGPPRMASLMGEARIFADGGGLCSPGRWRPEKRHFPEGPFAYLRNEARRIFASGLRDEAGRGVGEVGFVVRVAAGRFKANPFDGRDLEELRRLIADIFNIGSEEMGVAPRQCMRLRMIRRF